jgi:hypothetical protein
MGAAMKRLFLVLTAVVAISCFLLLSGCAQKSAGEINYLGLTYEQSSRMLMPDESLLYTGVSGDGLQLYVPARHSEAPTKVPEWIFARDGDGKYYQYRLSSVEAYAYVLYDGYNTNETVVFGLAGAPDSKDTPVEIQRDENGTWTAINGPVLNTTIEPHENSGDHEWTWGQRLQDGSMAPPGQYRVIIGLDHVAQFNISTDVPSLEVSEADYYNASRIEHYNPIMDILEPAPEYHVYARVFNDSEKTRESTISLLEYKARMKGIDPEKLDAAFDSVDQYGSDGDVMFFNRSTLIPSYTLYAKYEGRPAWYIVYNWEIKAVFDSHWTKHIGVTKEGPCLLMHVMLFVVDDETGKVLHWESCA